MLVPKDWWASTYLVQHITHGSWQHWLILRDVEVILSKSEGFWCTWMCSKPFRHYRQLLNKSFFQIAYHPRRYPDFCSSRSQVLLWPENEHEIEVFITEQLCWLLWIAVCCLHRGSVLTSWHLSTGLHRSKTLCAGGRPVGCLQWLLQGAACENFWAIQCENLELLLSVKLCFWLLCLYHSRHCRA